MRHTGKGTCKGCKPGTTFQDTEGQKSCMDCAEDCDKGYERVQQCTSTFVHGITCLLRKNFLLR